MFRPCRLVVSVLRPSRRNVLQAECEVPVETDVQRPLTDDVPPNEDLEWTWPVRRKLQDLRGGKDKARAPERHDEINEVHVDRDGVRRRDRRPHPNGMQTQSLGHRR